MATKEQDVRMRLRFDDSEADRGLNQLAQKFGKSFTEINSKLSVAQKAFDLVTKSVHAFAAAVGEAAEESNRFAVATREVLTIANQAELPLGKVEKLSKQLATTYGTAPVDQAKALYQAISAGAKDAAGTVEIANKLAIAGIADVGQTIDVLTTVTNSWQESNLSVRRASDILFKTVKQGKTRIDELASSFGVVAPLAASLGVTMEEVGAAVATLTLRGASTGEAFTQLRSILAGVTRNTRQAQKTAGDLNLEWGTSAIRAKGLVRFIREVTNAAKGNETALQSLFGRVEAVTGALALGSNNAEDFAESLSDVKNSTDATEDALKIMTGTMDFQIKRWEAVKTAAKISLGDAITESEVLKNLLKDITDVLDGLTKKYAKQDEETGKSKIAEWLDGQLKTQKEIKKQTGLTYLEYQKLSAPLSLVEAIWKRIRTNITLAAQEARDAMPKEKDLIPKGPMVGDLDLPGRLRAQGVITPEQEAVIRGEVYFAGGDTITVDRGKGRKRKKTKDLPLDMALSDAALGMLRGTTFGEETEEIREQRQKDKEHDEFFEEFWFKQMQKEREERLKFEEDQAEKLQKAELKQQKRREKQLKAHYNAMTSITASGMGNLVTELVEGAVRGDLDAGAAMKNFFGGLLKQIGQYWISLGAAQVALAAASTFAPGTWALTGGPTYGVAAGLGMMAAGALLTAGGAAISAAGSGPDKMAGHLGNISTGGAGPGRVYGGPSASERRDAQVPVNLGLGPQNTVVNVSISSAIPGSEARIGRELMKILDRTNALQVQRA